MTTYTQAKLEAELTRLIHKYGRGRELIVHYQPKTVKGTIVGEERQIQGEVVDREIYVYDKTLEEAIDTLDHEYFEYVLDVVFIRRHQNFLNALMKGMTDYFDKELYHDKESYIETLVRNEREERTKNEKQ
jgi:hypothetical protein